MGIKSLLFGGGQSREERQIEKHKGKMMNPHRQSDERLFAIHQLFQLRSVAGVEAMMHRFTYQTDATSTDEDEKRQTMEMLVELGSMAMDPIETYVLSKRNIYWPLMAFRKVQGDEAAEDLLLRALQTIDHGFAEEERRKEELISNLREFKSDRIFQILVDALGDSNDDVRVMVVEGLVTYGPNRALPPLIERLVKQDESARIRTVIMEVLADTGWSLMKYRAGLMGNMIPAYDIGPDGKIVRN